MAKAEESIFPSLLTPCSKIHHNGRTYAVPIEVRLGVKLSPQQILVTLMHACLHV